MSTLAPTRPAPSVNFNPLLPEYRQNPHPFLHRLREADPVHWSPVFQVWVLTRYADCVTALRDRRLSCSPREWHNYEKHLLRGGGAAQPQAEIARHFMLQIDPPDHTRLRALVSKAFTPRVVEAMRPKIQAIVDGMLDRVQQAGQMDLVADLAYPLPIVVIGRLLGTPPEDDRRIKEWSAIVLPSFGPAISAGQLEIINRAAAEFRDFFKALIEQRRRSPGSDLIDGLIAARDGENKLSDAELISTCILLVSAGHITTVQLLAKGMLLLLHNPAELQRLKREPKLIDGGIEEMLRCESPLQVVGRTALEDLEIGGKTIRKGQMLLVMLPAANRDPEQFPDPDRFDITRSPNRQIAFGYGDHFCAGAPLARLEAKVAISTILRRLPNLQLTEAPLDYDRSLLLRALKSLPVRFTPGGAV